MLDELLERIQGKTKEEKQALVKDIDAVIGARRFIPLPGPQTRAYLSQADVLLYGGQAGSGKTGLAIGLASQEHIRSIIFRRESAQTDGLEEFGKQVIGDTARFNGTDKEWSWLDGTGRSVKLAGLQLADDWQKHAGRERDFYAFDEAGEFLREQVASLLAWNRGPIGQRCRILLASNPPRTSDGVWVMDWFAPWLDPAFPDPAKPDELRWATMVKGSPIWQAGPGMYDIDGEQYTAMSFSFIPASLKDNPYRDTPEYRARLQSLPEPLRSQLLKGIFGLGGDDNPWQTIPTTWVLEAQNRWKEKPPAGVPMCTIGVDVAQGGADNTVLAARYDAWFDKMQVVPGTQTPGGTDVAGLVVSKRRDSAKIIIDIGGGWGADAYAHLKANDVDVVSYMGVKESIRRTQDNQLRFTNIRSEAYWKFREALNPDQVGGSPVALPPEDRILLADLCSPTFEVTPRGIKVEPKEALVKRIKRSPDRGDAVVMAWWQGARAATHLRSWEQGNMGRKPPQSRAIMGRR